MEGQNEKSVVGREKTREYSRFFLLFRYVYDYHLAIYSGRFLSWHVESRDPPRLISCYRNNRWRDVYAEVSLPGRGRGRGLKSIVFRSAVLFQFAACQFLLDVQRHPRLRTRSDLSMKNRKKALGTFPVVRCVDRPIFARRKEERKKERKEGEETETRFSYSRQSRVPQFRDIKRKRFKGNSIVPLGWQFI